MEITRKLRRLVRHISYQTRRGTLPLRSSGFSCFGEEQLLKRYISDLLPAGHVRTAVDIGAGDGRTGSNTLALFRSGWKGLGIEWDGRKVSKLAKLYEDLPDVSPCRIRVTPDNVLPLLEAYGVEKNFGVLNIDIDSYDYWVLDALLTRYRPSIIVTEVNEKIPPPFKFRVKYDPQFQSREHFYGYSITCLDGLCERRGYALIHFEYNNAFLVPVELNGTGGLTAEEAYRRGYLERPDRREKFYRNQNMEVLHSLSPTEGLRFIRQFFDGLEGKYELSIDSSKDGQAQNRDYLSPSLHNSLEPTA